jgi:hypothetical protein
MGAALLNLAWWLGPAHFGPLGGVPGPLTLALAALSLGVLAAGVAWASGAAMPKRRLAFLCLASALLVGHAVAWVFALGAWLAARRRTQQESRPEAVRARLHNATLYALHGALGLLLVGYGLSTYFASDVKADFAPGEAHAAGPHEARLLGVEGTPMAGSPLAASFTATVLADGVPLPVTMSYEDGPGAFYPLPSRHSTWDGDLYLNLQSITFAPGSCAPGVQAYQQGPQPCAGDRATGVRMEAKHLPGVALVWTATVLLPASMVGWMMTRREDAPAHPQNPPSPTETPAGVGDPA